VANTPLLYLSAKKVLQTIPSAMQNTGILDQITASNCLPGKLSWGASFNRQISSQQIHHVCLLTQVDAD